MNKSAQKCPSWRTSFAFPLGTPQARRDLLVGGTLLFLLPVGWILNMGHRLDVIHRVYHHKQPVFRGFSPWLECFTRGLKATTAIAVYLSLSAVLAAAAYWSVPWLWWPAGVAFVLGVYILPGGMTYNAAFDDIRYLYRPDKALARAIGGGRGYLCAWLIALGAISLSLLGLLFLGVGLFYTSVWAWMVVGHAFSVSLSLREVEAV